MSNFNSKSLIVVSIAALSFALFGCSGSNSSSNPAKPATSKAAKLSAAAQAAANAAQAAANLKQAGAIIGGNWSCSGDDCDTNEQLQIAADLSTFVEQALWTSPQNSSCQVSQGETVTVSAIQDNGKVATITANMVSTDLSYLGDPEDGTDCDNAVYQYNNPTPSDNASKSNSNSSSQNFTISLDRKKGILSLTTVSSASKVSGPVQTFVKAN
jgi:hypothetical protein